MGNESETTIVNEKQPIIIEENGNEKMDFEKSIEYGTKRILDGKCQCFLYHRHLFAPYIIFLSCGFKLVALVNVYIFIFSSFSRIEQCIF